MSDPVTRLNAALEGRYAIERELGEGGMATVYLADGLAHQSDRDVFAGPHSPTARDFLISFTEIASGNISCGQPRLMLRLA